MTGGVLSLFLIRMVLYHLKCYSLRLVGMYVCIYHRKEKFIFASCSLKGYADNMYDKIFSFEWRPFVFAKFLRKRKLSLQFDIS